MFSIPGSKVVDKNAILARDEAVQRQISINLQKKFDLISKAMFRERQMELYPNLLQVSQEPSLANLIANERDAGLNSDELQSYSLAKNNLMTIADEETSNYILDRLSEEQIQTLNQRFTGFVTTLTDNYRNIDKNRFIELIKTESFDIPENSVSEKGRARLDRKSDAQVRKDIVEKRDQQLLGERGPPNEIERERYQEYPCQEQQITPKKNPQKEKGRLAQANMPRLPMQ